MINHIKTKYLLQLESECKDKLYLLNAQEVALKKDLYSLNKGWDYLRKRKERYIVHVEGELKERRSTLFGGEDLL